MREKEFVLLLLIFLECVVTSSLTNLSSEFNSSYVVAFCGIFDAKSNSSETEGISIDLSCFHSSSESSFSTFFNSKSSFRIGLFDYRRTVSKSSFIISLLKLKSSFFNVDNGCNGITKNNRI